MRSKLVSSLPVAALAALLSTLAAPARAADIRCRIPFSFEVRGATLPPGEYTFTTQPGTLFVRGYRSGAVALTVGLQSTTVDEAKAIFEHQGDEYILTDVWTGDGVGRELLLPHTNGERGRTAQTGGASEQVVIPAL